jgi:hypothetical protein
MLYEELIIQKMAYAERYIPCVTIILGKFQFIVI